MYYPYCHCPEVWAAAMEHARENAAISRKSRKVTEYRTKHGISHRCENKKEMAKITALYALPLYGTIGALLFLFIGAVILMAH